VVVAIGFIEKSEGVALVAVGHDVSTFFWHRKSLFNVSVNNPIVFMRLAEGVFVKRFRISGLPPEMEFKGVMGHGVIFPAGFWTPANKNGAPEGTPFLLL